MSLANLKPALAAQKRRVRRRKLLEPREVAKWVRAVDDAVLDEKEKSIPPVVRWRKAVLGKDGPVSPVTRAILLTLSHHMDRYGQAFPSYKTLANESRYARRVVIRHMKLAVDECWLDVTPAQGHASGWRRNEYIACIPTFKDGAFGESR